jgi:glycosyltransferase involved in cell wall biosynthesis
MNADKIINNFFPEVTVITVCKNAGDDLIRTCDSVLEQVDVKLQFIVKDGVSTDLSLSYLESIKDSRIEILSQSDHGIYDAMNQAFTKVKGKWCIYLNAGDCFYSNKSLKLILKEIENSKESDLAIFSFFNEFEKSVTTYPKRITNYFLYRNGINHQVQLWKTEVLGQYLPFDEKYRILADQHLLLRAFKAGIKIASLKITGILYKDNGYSSLPKNQSLKSLERKKIASEMFDRSEIIVYSILEVLLLKEIRLVFFRKFRATFLFRAYRIIINLINSII